MFNRIRKLWSYSVYEQIVDLLDETSGKPKTINDWKKRVMICEELLKKKENDNTKLVALYRIMEESQEIMAKIESEKK